MIAQERRVYIALFLGFIALLVASTSAFFAVRSLMTETGLVDHTYQVQQQLTRLLSNHQDIQTGIRGYVLTGNPDYLQPYESARERSVAIFRELALLVADNPAQTVRLGALNALHEEQANYSELIIRTRQQNGQDAAMTLVTSGEDRRLLNDVRAIVAEMETDESALLVNRLEQERRAVTRLNWTLAISMVFALLVVAFGCAVIRHDFAQHHRDAAIILEQNLTLENRIAERTAQLQRQTEAQADTNEELQRFNNIMVDRELDMILLKREINELCALLGQPARYNLDFDKEVS